MCAAALPTLAAATPSDGKVSGTLTINGTKFPLTHIYARKREAWPADAKALEAEDVAKLSCGIVDVIMTNTALSEATIASILQSDYRGSDKIRGVRFIIDGAGTYKWATMYLLESGAVTVYGVTQTSGEITTGTRYTGKLSERNEEVTQVRTFDLTFDTPVKVQYTRTETENAEQIPADRFAEELGKALPGEWTIERWLGLGCDSASGTLVVGERSSPHAFQGTFHITTSDGDKVDEEVTISTTGTKVHFEGGKVSAPKDVWIRDVLDLDLWPNLMIGTNPAATDFVVLRKKQLLIKPAAVAPGDSPAAAAPAPPAPARSGRGGR